MRRVCQFISDYMGVLAGETVDVNVVGMLLSILWVVILPIALGLIVKYFYPLATIPGAIVAWWFGRKKP